MWAFSNGAVCITGPLINTGVFFAFGWRQGELVRQRCFFGGVNNMSSLF